MSNTYHLWSYDLTINLDNISNIKQSDFFQTIEKWQKQDMMSIWNAIDTNGDGKIDKEEIDKLKQTIADCDKGERGVLNTCDTDRILSCLGLNISSGLNLFLSRLNLFDGSYKKGQLSDYEIYDGFFKLTTTKDTKKFLKNINEKNILNLKKLMCDRRDDGTLDYKRSSLDNESIKLIQEHVTKTLLNLAKQEGLSEQKIAELTSDDDPDKVIENLYNELEKRCKQFPKLVEYAKSIDAVTDNELTCIKNSDNYMEKLLEKIDQKQTARANAYFNSRRNVNYSLVNESKHAALKKAIEESGIEKEFYSDSELIGLGNGKIDGNAKQIGGSCWLYAGINAFVSTKIGKNYIENNIYRDDEYGVTAVYLPGAKSKGLPEPKGDGIYLITNREIYNSRDNCSDGDIVAYFLAVEKLRQANGIIGNNGGGVQEMFQYLLGNDYSDLILCDVNKEMKDNLFAWICKDDDSVKNMDYEKTLMMVEAGAPTVLCINLNGKGYHAISVVGHDYNGNLLVQESNQLDSLNGLPRHSEDINNCPTFVMSKEEYYKLVYQQAQVYFPE